MRPTTRKVIAGLEVTGGVLGILLTSSGAMSAGLTLIQRMMIGSVGIPFAFCALAGRELWNGGPHGRELSMAAQALQLFSWSSPGLLYNLGCGAQLGFWIGPTVLQPLASIGSHLNLSVASEARGTALGINIIALTALTTLWMYPDPAPSPSVLESLWMGPDPAPLTSSRAADDNAPSGKHDLMFRK